MKNIKLMMRVKQSNRGSHSMLHISHRSLLKDSSFKKKKGKVTKINKATLKQALMRANKYKTWIMKGILQSMC